MRVVVLFALLLATTLFYTIASEANTLCPQCIRRHKHFLKAWSDNGFFEDSNSKPFDKKEFEQFENDLDQELSEPKKNTLAYDVEDDSLSAPVEDEFLDELLGDDAKDETADQYEEVERMEGIKRRLETKLDEKRFSQKSKGHRTLTKPTFETFKKLFFNFGAAA